MTKHLPFKLKKLIIPLLNNTYRKTLVLCSINLLIAYSAFAQQPVVATRPRIFLDAPTKAALFAKKTSNSADWTNLLAAANKYLPHTVIPWNPVNAGSSAYYNTGDVFYSYCGSNWEEAALILGMAHQLTKTNNAGANATAYSNKMLNLADVIIKGYADYPPNTNYQPNIFQYNSSYATRHVGKTIAIIYDWCYDELGATRKAALLNVMKDWFTFMSAKPYVLNQLQDDPTGNYYVGHLICAGYMGYAIGSDDPMSQKMIDFARQRAIGTPGSLNPNTTTSAETALNYFTQSVKGGLPSGASKSYLGPKTILAAPQKDGIPVQGWSYGGATTSFLIDYYYLVKSCTGEDLMQTDASFKTFMTKTAEALVHAYTPSNFQYDNANDNGSFLGCVSSYGLPLRLSAILEGTPQGPNIEYFYKSALKPVGLLIYSVGYPETTWEKMLYSKNRASAAYNYKPYYPIPTVNTYSAVPVNTGLNKFYMRSDWTTGATWTALEMGIAGYDQHNHNNAGHFKIVRGDSHDGDDMLLVGANEVPASGGNGISGSTNYSYWSSQSNTLFINDGTDYDPPYPDPSHTVGGQTSFGYDEPTHQEQNDKFSYFRSDLTSAYYISYYNPDTTKRSIRYFYRSFLYLRNSNVIVTYDKFQAKNSTNAAGQYKKHLRWHFLNQPVVSGNNVTATLDNSKLFVHTVIPATVNVAAVDESNNPDNVYGSAVNYAFNTNTWRAEVSVPNNPLKQDIITVMQPGAKNATEMVTTAMATTQNNMEGSLITVNGNTEVVLFNTSIAKYLVPVSAATYAYTGPLTGTHTLCGLDPDKNYVVTYNGATVTVTKSAAGTETASPSGVLSFTLQTLVVPASADLTSLTLNTGTLSPVFGKNILTYTANVTNATTSIILTPTSSDAAATITVKGASVTSGSAKTIALITGTNAIPVIVSVGGVNKTYTVTVTRAVSANAYLANIGMSPLAALTRIPGPGNNFTASVAANATSVTIVPTAADAGAHIKVNNVTVVSGSPSGAITLNASGATVIGMVVTAEDGVSTQTYSISVSRAGSSNAYLANINLNPSSALTRIPGPGNNFTASVAANVTTLKVVPTTADAGAHIKVNNVTVVSGSASGAITLNASGATVIGMVVTAEDGVSTQTYSITVSKAGSNNAYLSNISLSPSSALTRIPGPGNNFTASVAANVTTLKVVPTAADAGAHIKVNNVTVVSGSASGAITLNASGATVIGMVVTAEDGVSTQTYSISVTRSGSSNAYLSNIGINPSSALTRIPGPGNNFTASVAADVTTLKVVPTAADAGAHIKVNNVTVVSGSASGAITLNTSGATVIGMVVTAEDAVSTQTYSISVTRAAPQVIAAIPTKQPTIAIVQKPEQSVDVVLPDDITVKQAVSPNGDGINDNFVIQGIAAYPQNKVSIMNSNGSLIYEAKGYDNEGKVFDGRNAGGAPLQAGTYFYLIEYKTNDVVKRKSGYLVIKY
jgi:gliding motility-associated-like protein